MIRFRLLCIRTFALDYKTITPGRMMDPIFYYLLLVVTGLIAGFVNTLAGGGSSLTIPALMIFGMPADIANATNRIGVLLHSVVSTIGFKRENIEVNSADSYSIVGITIAGGLVGALVASFMPNLYLKPVLLGVMVSMALIILIKPAVIAPPPGTPVFRLKERPSAWVGLFLAGVYGGFVHAGVGFLLIGAIAGTLRYDLVRTNAFKMLCVLAFTFIALCVFIWRGQVNWIPGLVLSIGMMVGGHYSVKFAVKVNQSVLKWFLFAMTLVVSGVALFS